MNMEISNILQGKKYNAKINKHIAVYENIRKREHKRLLALSVIEEENKGE